MVDFASHREWSLFITGLFYASASISDHVASNGGMTGEWWIGNDLVGNGCGQSHLL